MSILLCCQYTAIESLVCQVGLVQPVEFYIEVHTRKAIEVCMMEAKPLKHPLGSQRNSRRRYRMSISSQRPLRVKSSDAVDNRAAAFFAFILLANPILQRVRIVSCLINVMN